MNKLVEEKISTKDDVAAKSHWIIVTQVKSNRIVYFTDDPEYQPHMEGDWYYCSSYLGSIPDGMTLRNCWGWRFNGGVFNDARVPPAKSAPQVLIEANRKVLLKVLQEKINLIRKPFLPSCEQGDVVRLNKLEQANLYIDDPEKGENLDLLKYVGVARNISMLEAARLIVAKAEENRTVLLESERFREQMTVAISTATTQDQLQELREWLLDKVYPALTKQFRFKVENTEPIDIAAPLSNIHRIHEIARLKIQLREAINRQRASVHSEYIQNDEIRKYKARLAKSIVSNKGIPVTGESYALLETYANSRAMTLPEASGLILNSLQISERVLLSTEQVKDLTLAEIEKIENLSDIRILEKKIENLKSLDLSFENYPSSDLVGS